MKVTSTYLIAAGARALIIATMFGISLWANHKIGSLERDVEQAKDVAAEKQSVAEQLELRSTDYKAKTEYLEQQIAELAQYGKRNKMTNYKLFLKISLLLVLMSSARRIRTVAATTEELCTKLAELGHPCE